MTIGRERLMAASFVVPAVVLIGLFVAWPTFNMFRVSLQDVTITAPDEALFSGVDNYVWLARDAQFRASVINTLLFTLLVVPLQTALALAFAIWANGPAWSSRTLRIVVFVPTVISLTVLSVLWRLMYAPATATGAGLINGLLETLHLPTQPFLTSPKQALVAMAIASIWQGVGLQMMIFIAGLQHIPPHLHEAAMIDGARRWRRFLNVTLPGIAPTAVFVLLITTIFALKLFVQPYIMTDGGGPQDATRSIVQHIYESAFFGRALGVASAAGVVLFVGVCVLMLAQKRFMQWAENLS